MSSNISIPVQLVLLLRRLVNVFSTFSLTHQYLLSSRQPSHSDASPTWSWLISAYAPDGPGSPSDLLGRNLLSGKSTENHPSHEQCGLRSDSRLALSPHDPSLQSPPQTGEQRPSPPPTPDRERDSQDTIHRLMNNPRLFDPTRTPRYPIVLCHGLYGFDVRGPTAFPSLRLHYWSSVLSILKDKVGAEVIVTGVPATGSVVSRAEHLDRVLQTRARGRGINLIAHSMGGLDCRHLISHVRPTEYVPLSLTTISTPHRGSPFMDWCAQHLGLGRRPSEHTRQPTNDVEPQTWPDMEPIPSTDPDGSFEKREAEFRQSVSNLPSSFTTHLLSLIDSPAYANLTTAYLNDVFNPSTPDDPRVKYFSVTSHIDELNIWHPLWFPKMVLDDAEKNAKERLKAAAGGTSYGSAPLWEQADAWGNDGLVTVQSARWGEFLGVLRGCDHWEIRGARGMDFVPVELPSGLANRITGEGWSFGDWSRFIGAWKKQENGSSGLELAEAAAAAVGEPDRIPQDGRNDPVVKTSTDKLSAVFDWIVDHVPTTGSYHASSPSPPPSLEGRRPLEPENAVQHDPVTKFDLERFYVALTRKLYDEGL